MSLITNKEGKLHICTSAHSYICTSAHYFPRTFKYPTMG